MTRARSGPKWEVGIDAPRNTHASATGALLPIPSPTLQHQKGRAFLFYRNWRPGFICELCNNTGLAWQLRWKRICLQEDPLEEGMATHSSILAWRISWMEEPGGLQSMGSQRVRQYWVTNTHEITHRHTHTWTDTSMKPSLLSHFNLWFAQAFLTTIQHLFQFLPVSPLSSTAIHSVTFHMLPSSIHRRETSHTSHSRKHLKVLEF